MLHLTLLNKSITSTSDGAEWPLICHGEVFPTGEMPIYNVTNDIEGMLCFRIIVYHGVYQTLMMCLFRCHGQVKSVKLIFTIDLYGS